MRSDGSFDVRSLCRAALVLAGVCACQPGVDEMRAEETWTNDARTHDTAAALAGYESADASAVGAADRLILSDGIGHARAGMTIGQLRQQLPSGVALHGLAPFMVDVDGMPVVSGADTLYYVLVVAGESSADDAAIEFVATLNDEFRTDAGVGPGTTLASAASAYGEPTLSYNVNDESREYARFPRAPGSLMFRVRAAAGDEGGSPAFAGQYPSHDEYNETRRYDPAARIYMVMVQLR
jgi:hypothetical protein